jgi:Rrf2 family transcriptional regulator, cysteine metabolism repressor
MKLSTKARYATRFMLDLAIHSKEGFVPLKDIAKRQGLSWKYLWNLIGPLKSAGLINSSRGSQGGYILSKPINQVNLKDIVNAVEGPLCLVDCVENPSLCKRSKVCVSRDIWAETSGKIQIYLESITLEDMVKRDNEKV